MNASFGIDHPLLAVHDINRFRDDLIAMGFNMTALGRHPWGTSTSLAMFEGCLLEIMGLYDASLIDEVPAGDFRFGRHVCEHLQQREGIALTALHSTDSATDADHAAQAGFDVAGHLEFGRDVTLPDGTAGRTKTTLALLPDSQFPRLSFFLCQQHRPELIYVPEWLEHPNSVTGICGVTIVARLEHHAALRARFEGIYGGYKPLEGGFQFETANGCLRILTAAEFEQQIGPLPTAVKGETLPCIVGMDFVASDMGVLRGALKQAGVGTSEDAGVVSLTAPEKTANTMFRFFPA